MKPNASSGLSVTAPAACPSPDHATHTSDSVADAEAAARVQWGPAVPERDPKRYRVLGEHGRGGLGRVSRAHDVELGRDVAIKELISRGNVSEVRFLREALITARLEHPGIVPVHEAGRWPDGTPFYAMKLVAGHSLHQLLTERHTVEERIGLLHHVIAVADAIAYAHGRNIIHRDLKPANVIVGDFGETVVIDWGLAKDLTSLDEPTIGGGPFREMPDDGLTSTGTVLGTPAYMAPEQSRAEAVDQRADVYAIGAMLWELCTLHRLPPAQSSHRRRLLRAAGIDHDLATIVDKALDPDADRRYPDAGSLAADLKAFKAGARIAARHYSLWAMLLHWTRRHRGLALAVAIAAGVAAAGVALYIRNITIEKDRADTLGKRATAALNELTLKHAEMLLATDPTAALDAVASYRGENVDRARQIGAEASGRGVATLRAVPHTESIRWVRGVADGSIVSLSTDGTIARTLPDGRSQVVVRGVKKRWPFTYAASRHLLAYVCDPADLCLLDIATGKYVHAASPGSSPVDLSFSPDGSQLAIVLESDDLVIFDVGFPQPTTERLRRHVGQAGGVLFLSHDQVVLGRGDGFKIVDLGGETRTFLDEDASLWAIGPAPHQLAVATNKGEAYLADTTDLRITGRTQLCRDRISGFETLRGKGVVAFTCKDGIVGLWSPRDGSVAVKARVEGHANRLAVSAAGDMLIAAADNGKLTVVDLQTEVITVLQGQGFQLTRVSAPTEEYPLVLSADVRGAIRAWPAPPRAVKVLAHMHLNTVESMLYNRHDRSVIAISRAPELSTYSEAQGMRSLDHTVYTPFSRLDARGHTFATYGSSSAVELWSLSPLTRETTLDTGHGTVSHVEFADADLLTAGNDGRLVRWTIGGASRAIHQFGRPIDTFVRIASRDAIVLATDDGTLWLLPGEQPLRTLRPPGSRVVEMLALPGDEAIVVAYTSGESVMLDTRSWQLTPLLRLSDAIRAVAVTANSQTLALAGNDNTVRVGVRPDRGAGITWTSIAMSARRIAFTRDGMLIALCDDGAVWLYSPAERRWSYLLTGGVALAHLVLSETESMALALDVDGRLLSIDLEAARKQLQPRW